MGRYKKIMCMLFFVIMLTGFIHAMVISSADAAEIFDYVARDPADVPPPVSRRHPTVVEVDLIAVRL